VRHHPWSPPSWFVRLTLPCAVFAAGCDGCREQTVFFQKNIVKIEDQDWAGDAGVKSAAPSSSTLQMAECAALPTGLQAEFDAHKDRVVLALFWAQWSAPDRAMIRTVETEIARDASRWHLRKIDIDVESDAAQACGVRSIPTLISFVRGKPRAQIVGAVAPAKLRMFLEASAKPER
jgi:thiol-disulfide isomerase/thioredoxin